MLLAGRPDIAAHLYLGRASSQQSRVRAQDGRTVPWPAQRAAHSATAWLSGLQIHHAPQVAHPTTWAAQAMLKQWLFVGISVSDFPVHAVSHFDGQATSDSHSRHENFHHATSYYATIIS